MRIELQVWKYYAYRALSTLGLLNPFLILFLLDRGISFTEISIAAGAMAATTVLLEVPSGYLGDRIGRRRVILLSKVSTAVATSLWFFVNSFAMIVVIQVLNGLGIVLRSGSDSAWLYELLDDGDTDLEFTAVQSRAQAISQWTYGLTGIGGAALYLTARPAAFVLAAVGAWAAVALVTTFPENARYVDEDEEQLSISGAMAATSAFLTNGATRSLILLSTVYAGVMYTGSQFIQPLVETAVPGTSLQTAGFGVHEVLFLAILYAVLSGASALAVDQADRLKRRLGVARSVVAVHLVGAGAMLLPAIAPVFVVPAIIAFRSIPSMAGPIRNGYLHEHADSAGRATEMSAISFIFALARIPVLVVAGRIADLFSATTAFVALGAYAIGAALLIVLFDRPLTISPHGTGESSETNPTGVGSAEAEATS